MDTVNTDRRARRHRLFDSALSHSDASSCHQTAILRRADRSRARSMLQLHGCAVCASFSSSYIHPHSTAYYTSTFQSVLRMRLPAIFASPAAASLMHAHAIASTHSNS